ncbi:MAG: HAD family phosphatase [Candidatus Aenigmarchaeota archaeon]|nr:HAD family phosphatase [Candidatus Aenigmarchaeota archaeon]
MIRAVVFDCGGVFVVDGVYEMSKSVIKEFSLDYEGVKKFFIENFRRMFVGEFSEHVFWERFKQQFGVGVSVAYLSNRLHELYTIQEPVKELAIRLKSNGYKVGFLSNSVKEIAHYAEQVYKINEFFDFGVYSHEVGVRKPMREIYALLLEKARCNPNEIVFVDNEPEYVEAANSVGIKGVLFTSPTMCIESLKGMGVRL